MSKSPVFPTTQMYIYAVYARFGNHVAYWITSLIGPEALISQHVTCRKSNAAEVEPHVLTQLHGERRVLLEATLHPSTSHQSFGGRCELQAW